MHYELQLQCTRPLNYNTITRYISKEYRRKRIKEQKGAKKKGKMKLQKPLNLLFSNLFSHLMEVCPWSKNITLCTQLKKTCQWWKSLKTVGTKSYLFCVGLEVLGGILLKLESTFLNGLFSATGKSLKAPEVEAMEDAKEEEGGRGTGRPSAWALSSQADRKTESRRARAASAVEYNFMFDYVLRSLNCFQQVKMGACTVDNDGERDEIVQITVVYT